MAPLRCPAAAPLCLALAIAAAGCTHRAVSTDGGAPGDQDTPRDRQVADGSGPGWRGIAPGSFFMGSPAGEPCRESSGIKETRHRVTLTRRFEVLATEVTQKQFNGVMGYDPSKFYSCGDSCPVEQVNWHQAVAYCNTLSVKRGLAPCYSCAGVGKQTACVVRGPYAKAKIYSCRGYRLPTEAEWEFAYRAGTTTAMYSGPITSCGTDAAADKIGWYGANAGGKTHPVGQKQPNAWGLYDMAGNVWEWTHDLYQKDLGSQPATDPWSAGGVGSFVIRGSSWLDSAGHLRAAYRFGFAPAVSNTNVGFRCVRGL